MIVPARRPLRPINRMRVDVHDRSPLRSFVQHMYTLNVFVIVAVQRDAMRFLHEVLRDRFPPLHGDSDLVDLEVVLGYDLRLVAVVICSTASVCSSKPCLVGQVGLVQTLSRWSGWPRPPPVCGLAWVDIHRIAPTIRPLPRGVPPLRNSRLAVRPGKLLLQETCTLAQSCFGG